MKCLVSGANGLLAKSLRLTNPQNINSIYLDKEQLDISDENSIKNNIEYYKPDIFINTAAYTKVDNAQINNTISLDINATSVRKLSNILLQKKILFIHFSTDYVFDGKDQIFYNEKSQKNPINYYGKTKLLGDNYIENNSDFFLIFRISWLFGQHNNNFVEKIVNKILKKEDIKVVNDQFGTPTSSFQTAEIIWKIISNKLFNKNHNKCYHFTSSEEVISWYEFALIINDIVNVYCNTKSKIYEIDTPSLNLEAPRPSYAPLSRHLFQNTFDIQMNDWKDYLSNDIKNLVRKI